MASLAGLNEQEEGAEPAALNIKKDVYDFTTKVADEDLTVPNEEVKIYSVEIMWKLNVMSNPSGILSMTVAPSADARLILERTGFPAKQIMSAVEDDWTIEFEYPYSELIGTTPAFVVDSVYIETHPKLIKVSVQF